MPGYKTVSRRGFYEETEKRSRFISYSFPVNSESQAQKYIKEIKSEHWDARHHVYAYSLKENFSEKYSDDGEPAGTAGLPILNIVKSFDIRDVLVIVARYFGGILLGTGGLRKMYSSGAKGAILNSEIVKMRLFTEVNLILNYKEYGKISGVLPEYKVRLINTEYADTVSLNFYIKSDSLEEVLKKISNMLNGNVKFQILSESYQIV